MQKPLLENLIKFIFSGFILQRLKSAGVLAAWPGDERLAWSLSDFTLLQTPRQEFVNPGDVADARPEPSGWTKQKTSFIHRYVVLDRSFHRLRILPTTCMFKLGEPYLILLEHIHPTFLFPHLFSTRQLGKCWAHSSYKQMLIAQHC